MRQIELLAPAKDAECGMAAIDCGADAVYIGGARFGARENASNGLEDIATLVDYAHRYWAKVYVTVNTLLHDVELPPALRLINELYALGADGLIIQDAGLLACELPPIPLIASTQMHNHSAERVQFLEAVGMRRAILARELSLEEIRAIRAATNIELEVFIHGALCVGYSGQCYLSCALGGRSGNRGQCAQPCRKPYTLVDGLGETLIEDRHLLSLRDLNQTEHLRDLIEAGVCSFKIEGRLKDKSYVTNVVGHYRQQLDAVLAELGMQKSSSGQVELGFTPDVTKTFNRGYCTHFLTGRGEEITAWDTPKMIGEPVGTVARLQGYTFVLDGEVELHNGDGLCFYLEDGTLCGTVVNGVQGRRITPAILDGLVPGTQLFRNHDHAFLTALGNARPQRTIGVTITLRETPDGFSLEAVDEDGNTAAHALSGEKTLAQKPAMAEENVRKQLAKTGGTAFACLGVAVEWSQPYFLPVAALNALRREALEALAQVREEARRRTSAPVARKESADAIFPQRTLTFEGNVLNEKAKAFYRRHGVTIIEPAAESGLDLRRRRVMTTRYCLKYAMDACPKQSSTRLAEPLTLLDAEGNRLQLKFDCKRCVMEVWIR